MPNHRIQMRQTAFSTIAAAVHFQAFSGIKGWSQSIDTETLPVFGVAISREVSSAADYDSLERRVELKVAIKRIGDEAVEDRLDEDADAVELVLLPVLRAAYLHAALSQTEIRLAGEGRQRVGMIELTFTCLLHTDLPD